MVSVFVSLALVISVVDGKHIHKRRKKQKESHYKHVHFFNVKHLSQQRSHKEVAHHYGHLNGNLHEGRLREGRLHGGRLHGVRLHVDHLHHHLHFKG